MLPASCLKRPMEVCLTGVEYGSVGATSTIQPKLWTSLGSLERSHRSWRRSHLRSDAPSGGSTRLMSSLALPSTLALSALAQYCSKFSSPERKVPHGVMPPEQLFRVPPTFLPLGSALVLTSSWPAATPRISKLVSPVMRRFSGPTS